MSDQREVMIPHLAVQNHLITFLPEIVTSVSENIQETRMTIKLAIKCRKTKQKSQRVRLVEVDEDLSENECPVSMVTHHIGSIKAKRQARTNVKKKNYATMTVNNKARVKFQQDCGATCNILPLKDYS